MFRRFGPNYMLMLYLFDLGCGQIALWLASHLRLLLPVSNTIPAAGARVPLLVYAYVIVIFAVVLPMVSVYDARRIFKVNEEAACVAWGGVLSSVLLAGVLFLSDRGVSRLLFSYFVVAAILLMLGYRILLRMFSVAINWATQPPMKVLIAGAGTLGRQAARTLTSAGTVIAGFVDDDPGKQGTLVDGFPVIGDLGQIPRIAEVESVTDVAFAIPYRAQGRLADLLVSLWRLPIRIYVIPDLFDLGFARARVEYLRGLTVFGFREPMIDGFQRMAKRLIDLVLGAMILACVSPVMAVIAIAVYMESPGPIIFRQQRVGENSRRFKMYKFRSMIVDAEQEQNAVNVYNRSGKVIHKRPDDPRVTRVGRILRRLSLDELPQLINVLRGDMSLVGPRPELPWIVAQYEPWQYQRLAVPQGMTSWYVVNGRSQTPMHLNSEEDLKYVRDCSLLQDFRILWKSLAAVAKGRGAF
jgi:exopolysaccharide biosynthesis polyprenyl glycosylphosphotransferase